VWFTVPALIGTAFFIIRTILMLILGHGAGDFHVEDGTAFDLDHGDSGSAFKILSIQAIGAFLMGFGWGGLGAYRGWGLPVAASVPVGLVVGSAMVWVLGRLLRWIAGLQSSGTVAISAALYEEGVVYTAIPASGSGRGVVRVVVDDRLRYYNAITGGDAIESQARVRVTEINADNTVTVTRVEEGL
jgi:hypothetical protein